MVEPLVWYGVSGCRSKAGFMVEGGAVRLIADRILHTCEFLGAGTRGHRISMWRGL